MSVAWTGLEDFKNQLLQLPVELTDESAEIYQTAAEDTATAIRAAYRQTPWDLDSLAQSVTVESMSRGSARWARLRVRHPLAWIFESGTQVRHTKKGASRGAIQPPVHVVFPRVAQAKRRMYDALRAMLRRHGLTVNG